ncbi:septin-7-like isoform X5 [Clytia hemisphaerica]|uniref:septin-7-like isoform X5 n=1 Tax=Clytia hemisphaerica TaxID=252671 RepID=UPI0034D4CE5F
MKSSWICWCKQQQQPVPVEQSSTPPSTIEEHQPMMAQSSTSSASIASTASVTPQQRTSVEEDLCKVCKSGLENSDTISELEKSLEASFDESVKTLSRKNSVEQTPRKESKESVSRKSSAASTATSDGSTPFRKRSITARMSDGLRNSGDKMKKGKLGNATAFIRKKKEKWRPSLNGSEDIHEGSSSSSPTLGPTGSKSDNSIGSPSPTTPRAPREILPQSPSDDGNSSIYDDGSEGSSVVDGGPATPTPKKGLENYVGFANLPNQVFRKSVKKGFQFTLMVVGESGLGKSTLINSLFLTDIYTSTVYEDAAAKFGKTMTVNASTFELKEGGVRLQLTVVDTPGFGDNIDNTDCWNSVIQNIEAKFEDYLNAESRVNRTTVQDTRVHCCLYFIAPTGHGLKPLDVEFMKKLHNKVNIVPVIAKADTLTGDECNRFKQQILKEIEDHQINIYRFPPLSDDESENDLAALRRIPFAVVGSNTVLEVGGKKIRGRKYPWGIVEVENIEHCDFIALRNLLIRTHMQDLIDVTNDVHYENFRSERLSVLTGGGNSITSAALNINPMEQIEREREDQEKKLKKMEQEMEQVFEMKVKEKKKKLKDSEAEFNRKFDVTMKTLEQTKKELEDKRRKFEEERNQFDNSQSAHNLDSSRSSSRSSLQKESVVDYSYDQPSNTFEHFPMPGMYVSKTPSKTKKD